MLRKNFKTIVNRTILNGSGIFFDEKDLTTINEFYFGWKRMNEILVNAEFRRVNLHEIISEGLVATLFNYTWKTQLALPHNSYDLFNYRAGRMVQVKGASIINSDDNPGATSFGPDSKFDELIFIRVDCEKDLAFIYNIRQTSDTIGAVKVNANETFADQASVGRRPRFIFSKETIKELGGRLVCVYSFADGSQSWSTPDDSDIEE